jgi:hypothetical protein
MAGNPNAFGNVDHEQIAGLRKLFDTAGQVAEQNAQLQFQVQVEQAHNQRLQAASNAYAEAMSMADKNPFVANRRIEGVAAGLMSSRDERDQKIAQNYLKMKVPLTATFRGEQDEQIPGYTGAKKLIYGYGTEGPISKVDEKRGYKEIDPKQKELDDALKRKRLAAPTAGERDVDKYKEKYLTAHTNKQQLISNYGEKNLQEWTQILSKEAPDYLNRLQKMNDQTMDTDIAAMMKEAAFQKISAKMDPEKLKAVAQYMKHSAGEKTYEPLLKEKGQEWDEDQQKFVKVGSKKTGSGNRGKGF